MNKIEQETEFKKFKMADNKNNNNSAANSRANSKEPSSNK
jgi:hypothetical protein